MHDVLENGRKVRTLNILDDYNREPLRIAVGYSFPAEKVVRIISELCEWRGTPQQIRTDNGPEFIAQVFEDFSVRGILSISKSKRASLRRTPISNDSIAAIEKMYLMLISSPP